jgi:hypothetical protein
MNTPTNDNTGECSVDHIVEQVYFAREAGHPWSQEKNWDQLYLRAETEERLDQMIEHYRRKFWDVWIRDNTGKISAVLYQPRGATGPWSDSYEESLIRVRSVLPNVSDRRCSPEASATTKGNIENGS